MPSLSHLALRDPQFLYSPALLEVLSKQAALTVLAQSLQDPSSEIRVASLQGLGNILFHPEKVRARGICSPSIRDGQGPVGWDPSSVTWDTDFPALCLSFLLFRNGRILGEDTTVFSGTCLFTVRRDQLSCTTPEAH